MPRPAPRTKAYIATPTLWPAAARGLGAAQHIVQVTVYMSAPSKAAAREHLEALGVHPGQAHAVLARARLTSAANPTVAALTAQGALGGTPRAFVAPVAGAGGRRICRIDSGPVFTPLTTD